MIECDRCPGYCCSYPAIPVNKRDVKRFAKHFGIGVDEAEKKFTRAVDGNERIMRRQRDGIYGRICKLFDTENRKCRAYAARPSICRSYASDGRCGYYDFLSFEREALNDPDHIALTDNR